VINYAPGEEIVTSPGFAHRARAGTLDRDDTLLFPDFLISYT